MGKDTAAEALIDRGFTRFAFADILKQEVNDMLSAVGVTDNVHNEEQKKFWRDLLVFWGRKRRQINKDYWITQLERDMDFHPKRNRRAVISDVRYMNEVNWVQEQGGKVIWIHRPGYQPTNEEENMSFDVIRQQAWDIINLDNNGTIEELHKKVLDIVAPQDV